MWACANFRTTRFCRWATRQWRSHQNTHKTFPSKSFSLRFSCKWFLCFFFWAVIWSYIVDLFAALHELASASVRTILKLASSVRALLKPYGDTLSTPNAFKLINFTQYKISWIFPRQIYFRHHHATCLQKRYVIVSSVLLFFFCFVSFRCCVKHTVIR